MGGGSEKGRGRGAWLGPPASQGPPVVPAEGRPKYLSVNPLGAEGAEAKFWLSKEPKQNFGCQPQTSEGEEGGYPYSSYGVRPF